MSSQIPRQSLPPQLILASSSPYRAELLSRLGLPFAVETPDIDESPRAGEAPDQTAMRLAQDKAETISRRFPDALIIGSDQVATLDGEQIGKPGNHENALKQLQKMRGRQVTFHTALCLLNPRANGPHQACALENVRTLVTFRQLDDDELDAYLHIEQPYDCAGSAKNEGLGIALIEKIESADPTALTGLPLIALTGMLRDAGVRLFGLPQYV
ncbi:MAG: septum formation inhibitor Maf [Herminiimonas sp.]|nr:septum formation inhibitor Maf [Herminiimonas sp.]